MKRTLFYFSLLTCLLSSAQESLTVESDNPKIEDPNKGSHFFVQAKFHTGNHGYTGETLTPYLKDGYVAGELRFGWQTSGSELWHRALNYPLYGIGIYKGKVGDPDILGKPKGVYGFFHFPLWRRPKHHFDIEMAFGCAFDLEPYNSVTNPHNDAYGSEIGLYFNFNLGGNLFLNKTFDLTYGLDLTHYSAARVTTPNYGLNMAGINLGLRYNFNVLNSRTKALYPEYKKHNRAILIDRPNTKPPLTSAVVIYGGIGYVMHQEPVSSGNLQGPEYFAWSLYGEWEKRLHNITAISLGIDLFYDGSHHEQYMKQRNSDGTYINTDPSTAQPKDFMLAGAHAGHTLYINKVSFISQLGFYFYNPHNYKGIFYFRVAVRYNFTDKFFAQVGLKTMDSFAADWAEWGVGVKLFNNKK